MPPLLTVENLRTTFFSKKGPLHAVDGVSYTIDRGETLGIVGESGCGKSVTSFSILGLVDEPGKVTGGKVIFDGTELTQASEEKLRRVRGGKIAMIFQEPMTALNPVLTIGEQISEQILAHENISKAQARERAVVGLRETGIPTPETRVDAYPHQLSGGMRQRAMIAMALSCSPQLLIADEPTTALDVTIQAQILELLQKLKAERGMAMQFITHDLGVISEVADRVAVMYAGRIVEEAPTEALFVNPLHPYTQGLLRALPRLTAVAEKLSVIEGSVPPLGQIPKGCRFRNRCPMVTDTCAQSEPELEVMGAGRKVACFNVEHAG